MCQRESGSKGAGRLRPKIMKSECKCILKNINRATRQSVITDQNQTLFLVVVLDVLPHLSNFRWVYSTFRVVIWFYDLFIMTIIVIVQLQTKFHSKFITTFPDENFRSWKHSRFFLSLVLRERDNIALNVCVQGYAFIQALNCVGSGTSEHIVCPVSRKQIKSWRAKKKQANEMNLFYQKMRCRGRWNASTRCSWVYVYVFAARTRKLNEKKNGFLWSVNFVCAVPCVLSVCVK